MSVNRRIFLKRLGTTIGTAAVGSLLLPSMASGKNVFEQEFNAPSPDVSEEDFWVWVQESFTVSPNIINLNNGGVSPQPKVTQDTFEKYNRLCNEAPSYYMWNILNEGREALRADLASFAGCSPEEIAIDRNTTEALDTVIYGLQLKPGDEVVLTKQDYPNVINAWKMREKRDGIVLRWINLELPSEDEDALVHAYTSQFSDKTKVVNITHIINWIGQIIPVKKIAKVAHEHGIDVVVDGAHTFALLDFKIPDLDCDYFGTSLHKWMCAPFGSGLLYVKKDKINKIYSLCPDSDPLGDKITKFEALGTRSFASEMAIGSSLDFHLAIGSKRKEKRLRALKDYWTNRVKNLPGIRINTSFKPQYACVIGLVSVEGKKPGEVVRYLFDKYKIHTTGIEWENISGVRVTPSVYTTFRDLDKLVLALQKLVS
ncbi:MAG: aminotransferase class V-fold PLP-dependent enzyme [Bacteroidetes bacterium]|nr:aminotransferase class V-fold PLP-dependent enzyme [Bacteroidota bacterium]